MQKKKPHPEKRPHLEGSFCTVVFFNRLGFTSHPTVEAMQVDKVPISV